MRSVAKGLILKVRRWLIPTFGEFTVRKLVVEHSLDPLFLKGGAGGGGGGGGVNFNYLTQRGNSEKLKGGGGSMVQG